MLTLGLVLGRAVRHEAAVRVARVPPGAALSGPPRGRAVAVCDGESNRQLFYRSTFDLLAFYKFGTSVWPEPRGEEKRGCVTPSWAKGSCSGC